MPGIALLASVKVNRILQRLWNARGKVRMSTFCRDGTGEGNTEGCYEKSLADASTTSLGIVSGLGTHKSGRRHGCE
jgi:hypothetical protein